MVGSVDKLDSQGSVGVIVSGWMCFMYRINLEKQLGFGSVHGDRRKLGGSKNTGGF